MEKIKRKRYIDVLKGIGLFYVVLNHIIHIPDLKYYIRNITMPLFFLLSGFIFRPAKYSSFKDFFKSVFKSLYIPYVFFFLVTFSYWVIIERRWRGGEYSILHQFLGLFYGTYEGNHLYFNSPLWYLPCLFCVVLMFYFIAGIKNNVGILSMLILSFAVGTLIVKNGLTVLPLGLHTAFFGLVFYGIGFISKPQEDNFINLSLIYKIILLIACSSVQILAVQSGYFSVITLTPIYYIPVALVGIIFYLILSILIKENKILEFFGRNSLVVLGFQEPIYRAVIQLFSIALHLDVEFLRNNIFFGAIMTVVYFILIAPIIYLYNNYIKKLIQRIV